MLRVSDCIVNSRAHK